MLYLLSLYNSLSLKLEPFETLEAKKVKMYTCGPSTYQRPHIGNYRTFLFEDILQRYLEFLGYNVTRLIALTNVEDKALAQAKKDGLSVEELTSRNEDTFFKELKLLHIKQPDYMVRASDIIDQTVILISHLMTKGIAYKFHYKGAENIYFNPLKFSSFGKLAHLDMNNWPKTKRRFHKDTYPGMPWNKGDFILWHGCKINEKICWNTSIGRGRPAWNIQDAAMVTKHLGYCIDIACGGIDNIIRHHDYTLAVAEAVSGKNFAKYWLHGGHLYFDGKKMSKSKGNILYIEDLIQKNYNSQHIRFLLIFGAYREKLNFTWKSLEQTSLKLDKLKGMITELQKEKSINSAARANTLTANILLLFQQHMNDDLDVESAFKAIYTEILKLYKALKKGKLNGAEANAAIIALQKIDQVLQVLF